MKWVPALTAAPKLKKRANKRMQRIRSRGGWCLSDLAYRLVGGPPVKKKQKKSRIGLVKSRSQVKYL